MKIILQEKEWSHWVITIRCTSLFLCLKQWKITRCKGRRGEWMGRTREWMGRTRENTGTAADESQKQKWGDRGSKERWQNSTFCIVDGSLSSQKILSWSQIFSNYRGPSRTPRWLCKRWFKIVCIIHWARIIGITKWRPPKSWTFFRGFQDVYDKQLTQYLLETLEKRRMHPSYSKFRNRNVQTFGYVYPNTNGLKHGPVRKIQVVLQSEICKVILYQDGYGKGNSWNFFENTVGKKFQIENAWECLLWETGKKTTVVWICGWFKTGWKETEHRPNAENSHERRWFGRTHTFRWSCYIWFAPKENVK